MSIEQYLGVFLLCALSFYLGTRWAKNEFNEYNKGCLIFRIPLGCNDAKGLWISSKSVWNGPKSFSWRQAAPRVKRMISDAVSQK